MSEFSISKYDVAKAVDYQINEWWDMQYSHLQSIKYPSIEANDTFLKGLAWFNFGSSAAKTLFPESFVTTALTMSMQRLAMPIWIASKIKDEFYSSYGETIKVHNNQLQTNFETLKNKFVLTGRTIAKNFMATKEINSFSEEVSTFLKDMTFNSQAEKEVYLRNLVEWSGIIELDDLVIKKRTQDGFGNLCKKVRDIYLGSKYGPGLLNTIKYSPTDKMIWKAGKTTFEYKTIKSKEEQDWLLSHAWQMRVHHNDGGFSSDPDVTYIVKENNNSSANDLIKTFKGSRISLEKAQAKMKEMPKEITTSFNTLNRYKFY